MKTLSYIFTCLLAINALSAQEPLPRNKALGQLFHNYDPAKKTARWVCTATSDNGWPCDKHNVTVSITVLLMAEVLEDKSEKAYIVASAEPADLPNGFDCHMCAPAIGVAVFKWQGEQWTLQSANSTAGFYGEWGNPPGVDMVEVGPEKHGLLLYEDDLAQGYAWSFSRLLLPVGDTVKESWRIQDEQDNDGAYDPTDKLNKQVPYRSSAAFKFIATDRQNGGSDDYYDLEVISRGRGRQNFDNPVKSENWTEIYRFSDGKYKLIRHTDFIEIKKAR
ncbi:MAG: hypothetical protein ABSF28_11340 [Terracidiphilus sp.]|jgi:hypothetical protein